MSPHRFLHGRRKEVVKEEKIELLTEGHIKLFLERLFLLYWGMLPRGGGVFCILFPLSLFWEDITEDNILPTPRDP